MRVGFGYDIHALKAGRKLILGGIEIPYSRGLLGHSDGDALLHAIADAVLGAMGEGDIGEHFSDRDGRYKDASSLKFIEKVTELLTKRKFKILNIDSTILCQEPKLYQYKMKMEEKISHSFKIKVSQVSVKAKTNEGFDTVGKKEAIACFAVVSLKTGKIK